MAVAQRKKTATDAQKPRQSLSEIAYDKLKHRIITLAYKPGGYLNEATLSEDLEIGRTPVHSAVRRLTHEGLIEMIPRKGLIVKAISLQEVSEIIDLRLVNEAFCAGQASDRITPAAAAKLRSILARTEKFATKGDIQSQMLLDREFHDQIAQTAGNQVLVEILRNLHERSMRIWFVSLNNEKHASEVLTDHAEILSALESGSRERAEDAMRQHILAFKTNISELI